ncbi:hypothetical protein ACA910_003812 [Epithemia clementina (nom. ined.)]
MKHFCLPSMLAAAISLLPCLLSQAFEISCSSIGSCSNIFDRRNGGDWKRTRGALSSQLNVPPPRFVPGVPLSTCRGGGGILQQGPDSIVPCHRCRGFSLCGARRDLEENDGDDDDDDLDNRILGNSTVPSSRLASSFFTKDKDDNDNDVNNNNDDGIFTRFTNPRIDDPALPLSDAVVAQIIAPSLQVGWLALNHAPSPTWLQPNIIRTSSSPFTSMQRGSLLAPALIHGAALAVCWLAGALAARAYERDALGLPSWQQKTTRTTTTTTTTTRTNPLNTKNPYNDNLQMLSPPSSPRGIWIAVLQAGAFATGLLILATQVDLFVNDFGFQFVQYGDSPATDFRIQVAVVELVNDVVFEAVTLLSWRLYLAAQQPQQQPPPPP